MADSPKRYAVVTGSNKGIGFGICKQLASNGITVVVTARDEKRGFEAVQKLKEFGVSDANLVFHQLDVTDPNSIASLADFIKTKFGKLDILVNNAGIIGANVDRDALLSLIAAKETSDWGKAVFQSYKDAEAGVTTNYYGVKGMCQALIPLLQFSHMPRIVNVSSSMGQLENLPDGWAKEVLSDVESLTEEKLDEILNEFLKDFKEGLLETKGWPKVSSAYIVSKAAVNAYTRMLGKHRIHNNPRSFILNHREDVEIKSGSVPDAIEID